MKRIENALDGMRQASSKWLAPSPSRLSSAARRPIEDRLE
jgi:hypothetical protein